MERVNNTMVKLRIKEILEEQHHTKYWLAKRLGMCYRNFNNMVENNTNSIRFDTLQRLCDILNVSVGELFEQVDE